MITDRVDRKKAMVAADFTRFVLTLIVALAVLAEQVEPARCRRARQASTGTSTGLYVLLLVATLLLGTAEVLRDNCGQTFMPSIVEVDQLEKANGRMWSAEQIANTFIGPPLGSLLLIAAFSLPFFVDAASFFVAAILVWSIPGSFRAERPDDHVQAPWKTELAEGFRWLWANDLLALDVHHPRVHEPGLDAQWLRAGAVRPGGPRHRSVRVHDHGIRLRRRRGDRRQLLAPWMSKRLGSGTCLAMTLGSSAATSTARRPVVVVAGGDGGLWTIGATLGATWNVITVSLRQSIIPPHLLGRVNSVYRFFAWGMMPIGALHRRRHRRRHQPVRRPSESRCDRRSCSTARSTCACSSSVAAS